MSLLRVALVLVLGVLCEPALAQAPGGPPPAVTVAKVERKPITESKAYVGRIQATDRVDIVARVTAFLEERLFTEGAEVEKGAVLYRLERGPFEADLQAKQAAVVQNQALLRNANTTLGRASALLSTPAGQRSNVDNAQAQSSSQAAQVAAAQAQARASQISLDYTEIRAPIAGKIGRTAVTPGNVVTPGSGVLTTLVSQDPMYVVFSVAVRDVLELRNKYADRGGFDAVVARVKLPDGRVHSEPGKLVYLDPVVAAATDTLTVRATVANPRRSGMSGGGSADRELVDGEFVTIVLEGREPVQMIAVPRVAVLNDQQGPYVLVVDADSKAQQRRVKLGPSTQELAVVADGLKEGESVVVEGMQAVRQPGMQVKPSPQGAPPAGRSGEELTP